MNIYVCKHCGSMMLQLIKGQTPSCCGEDMGLLIPNTVDAATEKHLPVITKADGKLTATVGAVGHPMTQEHSIQWIAAVSDNRMMKKDLAPGETPELTVCEHGWHSIYAYCNLHGLWKSEVK